MTKIELLQLITRAAKNYREDAVESVKRDSHMNSLKGEFNLSQDEVDAFLTGFINFVGTRMAVDYGLYASDLGEKVEVEL